MTFSDGSSVLEAASVSNGIATFSVSALSVGPHSFSASFAPGSTDPDFLASTLTTLGQTVSQDCTVVTLSEPPTVTNPSVFGQPVTINATVTAAYITTAAFVHASHLVCDEIEGARTGILWGAASR